MDFVSFFRGPKQHWSNRPRNSNGNNFRMLKRTDSTSPILSSKELIYVESFADSVTEIRVEKYGQFISNLNCIFKGYNLEYSVIFISNPGKR